MVSIFTTIVSPRLQYILEFIFEEYYTCGFSLHFTVQNFLKSDGFKINYSHQTIENCFQIKPEGLLFENNINHEKPKVTFEDKLAVIFAQNDKNSYHFDVFSAVFWFISRYEEYQIKDKDLHGRFSAHNALAFQHLFHDRPIVNEYLENLEIHFAKNGFILPKKYTKSNIQPTIDIDSAFAYLNKGFKRQSLSLARNVLKGKVRSLKQQILVFAGKKQDPYDTYAFMHQLHQKFQKKPVYFFLLGNYGPFDKNVPHSNKKLQHIIRHVASHSDVGIHPSYGSHRNTYYVEEEITRLRDILTTHITKSRQHYIKMSMPETYQILLKNGIKEDYSMGFADDIGFRAGICHPFYFFDLSKNQKTELKIIPFFCMDVSFSRYLKLTKEEVLPRIKPLFKRIHHFHGDVRFIFHNETFSENETWKGWREVYTQFLTLSEGKNS